MCLSPVPAKQSVAVHPRHDLRRNPACRDTLPVHATQVLLPYAHAKLSALYERRHAAPPPLPGLRDFNRPRQQEAETQQQQDAQQQQSQSQQGQERRQLQPWQQRLQRWRPYGGAVCTAADRLGVAARQLRALALHAFIEVTADESLCLRGARWAYIHSNVPYSPRTAGAGACAACLHQDPQALSLPKPSVLAGVLQVHAGRRGAFLAHVL